MNKELEAWKRIKEFDSGGEFVSLYDFHAKDIEIVDKALTPPTADEVIKALSVRYNNAGVQYLEDKKSFVYSFLLIPICCLKKDGTVFWGTNDLPPDLITMIGKFYEGERNYE